MDLRVCFGRRGVTMDWKDRVILEERARQERELLYDESDFDCAFADKA